MAKYRITGPDGTYEITAPDDASEADILAYAQRNAVMTKPQEPQAPEAGFTPPAVSPRQGREDESMARYEQYKNSPQGTLDSLPKVIRTPLQTLRDSVTGIGQGKTFNIADEIQAGMATPLEMLRQGSMDVGKAYDSALGNARREQKNAEIRSPIANMVGQVAGGMATGAGAQGSGLTLLNSARPTIGSMALRGAGEGAAYGSLYGFGSGEGTEDRLGKAAMQGGLGALTGGAMGAIAGRGAEKAANKLIPSAETLGKEADAAYKAVDQSGITLAPKSFDSLVDDIAVAAKGAKINDKLHPDSSASLEMLQSMKGSSPTISEVDQLRQIIGESAASPKPGDSRIAMVMRDKLDDFVDKLKPSDVVGVTDPLKAVSSLNQARELYAMRKKADLVAKALNSADLRAASTGSGGNIDNATRQNLRKLLEGPQSRGFTEEERRLTEQVIRGGNMQNLARLVGKLSPEGNGLMMILHGGALAATGGASAPMAAVGYGAKKFADSATQRNVEALSRVIRSGGALPQPQMLPAQQRALLEAAIRTSGQGLLD